MLPAPAAADIVISSPDAIVAGMPYLLGFAPSESAVLLWLRDRRILLTQRIDLPAAHGGEHDEWLAAVWSHAGARHADGVLAVLVSEGPERDDLADLLHAEAVRRGVAVRDVLAVSQGRWRSLLCRDPGCCDPRGREVDAGVAALVAAEFTGAGVAPAADRGCLEEELRPGAGAAVDGPTRVAWPRRGSRRETLRDEAISAFVAAVDPSCDPSNAEMVVQLLVPALEDIRVRDTVLWEVSRLDGPGQHQSLRLLSAAVRAARPGEVAPAATCAAVAAWLLGDGARARIALGHAISDRPDYSLALLVDGALRVGLPPTAWREAMGGLTREECRHGHPA